MIGVPGAGKSTWVDNSCGEEFRVTSADDFLTTDGVYTWTPDRSIRAHRQCLRSFTSYVVSGMSVVCDNTNTALERIAPYIALGQAFCAEVRVIHVRRNLLESSARCVHNVPYDIVSQRHTEIQQMLKQWPAHWPKVEEVFSK